MYEVHLIIRNVQIPVPVFQDLQTRCNEPDSCRGGSSAMNFQRQLSRQKDEIIRKAAEIVRKDEEIAILKKQVSDLNAKKVELENENVTITQDREDHLSLASRAKGVIKTLFTYNVQADSTRYD